MTPWPSCCSILAAVPTGRGHRRSGVSTSSFTSIRISNRFNWADYQFVSFSFDSPLGDSAVHLATGRQTHLGDCLGSQRAQKKPTWLNTAPGCDHVGPLLVNKPPGVPGCLYLVIATDFKQCVGAKSWHLRTDVLPL